MKLSKQVIAMIAIDLVLLIATIGSILYDPSSVTHWLPVLFLGMYVWMTRGGMAVQAMRGYRQTKQNLERSRRKQEAP